MVDPRPNPQVLRVPYFARNSQGMLLQLPRCPCLKLDAEYVLQLYCALGKGTNAFAAFADITVRFVADECEKLLAKTAVVVPRDHVAASKQILAAFGESLLADRLLAHVVQLAHPPIFGDDGLSLQKQSSSLSAAAAAATIVSPNQALSSTLACVDIWQLLFAARGTDSATHGDRSLLAPLLQKTRKLVVQVRWVGALTSHSWYH